MRTDIFKAFDFEEDNYDIEFKKQLAKQKAKHLFEEANEKETRIILSRKAGLNKNYEILMLAFDLANKLGLHVETQGIYYYVYKEGYKNKPAEYLSGYECKNKGILRKIYQYYLELLNEGVGLNEGFDFEGGDIDNDFSKSISNLKTDIVLKNLYLDFLSVFTERLNIEEARDKIYDMTNQSTIINFYIASNYNLIIQYDYDKYKKFPVEVKNEKISREALTKLVGIIFKEEDIVKFIKENFESWVFNDNCDDAYLKPVLPRLNEFRKKFIKVFYSLDLNEAFSFDNEDDDKIDQDLSKNIAQIKYELELKNFLFEFLCIFDGYKNTKDSNENPYRKKILKPSEYRNDIVFDYIRLATSSNIDIIRNYEEASLFDRSDYHVVFETTFRCKHLKSLTASFAIFVDEIFKNSDAKEFVRQHAKGWFFNEKSDELYQSQVLKKLEKFRYKVRKYLKLNSAEIMKLYEGFEFSDEETDYDEDIKRNIQDIKKESALKKGFEFLKKKNASYGYGGITKGIGLMDLEMFANTIFNPFGYVATLDVDTEESEETGTSYQIFQFLLYAGTEPEDIIKLGTTTMVQNNGIENVLMKFQELFGDIIKPIDQWFKEYDLQY